MQQPEADSGVEEEYLLNFVVNSLDEELAINLDEDVEVTTETLYEVLAGTSTGRISINHVCETTDDSPHTNIVRGHLTDQLDLDTVEAVRDTLLQRDALGVLPDRPVEVIAGLHFDPYYDDEDGTEALYSSEAKRGITTSHAYAALYTRIHNKRCALAVRQLVAGGTTSDVFAGPLGLLNGFDLGVETVCLGYGFYNSTCLGLLHAYNYAYVMPIVKQGETIQEELSKGWSREIEHDLAGEVTFPVLIDCVYQQGRYDKRGTAHHGYAIGALFIDTPRDVREHYSKCFGVKSSYRLTKQSLAFTSSQDVGPRLVIPVMSLLLQNSWWYLHWRYVAVPHRGGRRLQRWPFMGFCETMLRAAWTAFNVRRAVPADQPLDNRFFRQLSTRPNSGCEW